MGSVVPALTQPVLNLEKSEGVTVTFAKVVAFERGSTLPIAICHPSQRSFIRIGCSLARPKRFELLTPRFVVWCSIQLSYGRVFRLASGVESRMDPGRARKRRERAL